MGFCTSKGYRPDKGMMSQGAKTIFDSIMNMGNQSVESYTVDLPMGGQKTFTPEEYDKLSDSLKKRGTPNYSGSFLSDKPEFRYKPGESGYNLYNTDTGYANTYNPVKFESPDVDNIYNAVSKSQTEGIKSGLQTGMQGLNKSMGRRGLLGSGMQMQGGQQMASTAADKIGEAMRSAIEKNRLLGADYDWKRQMANDQSRQFASQMGLQSAATQSDLDRMFRSEQMEDYLRPLNMLSSFYTGQLPSASKDQPGLGSSLIGGITGMAGSLLGNSGLF
jgi:hypothetical protein